MNPPNTPSKNKLKRLCVITFVIFLAMGGAAFACICGNNCEIIGDCCEDCGTGGTWCSTNCPNDCCGTTGNGTHVCGPSMCAPEIVNLSFGPEKPLHMSTNEAEPASNEEEKPAIQVEIQDGNTSLVQDIDPTEEHLQVTVRQGDTYQIISFDQKDAGASAEKNAAECALAAVLTCGQGNVTSVTYESHIFWSCCNFTCATGGGIEDPDN